MDESTRNREWVMMRRELEQLVIGERWECKGATVTRVNSLHYQAKLASGTVADIRARHHSIALLEDVMTLVVR